MGIVGNTPERKVAERLTNAIAKCILEREDGGWWFEHAKVSLMIEHELRALRAENERLRAENAKLRAAIELHRSRTSIDDPPYVQATDLELYAALDAKGGT